MEGAVTVSFTVSEGGIPADLRLLRGSGYRLLDEEALNTVKRASPLPAIRGTVEIPIRFRLSDHE
jgi:protein TonB